ncbi:MAG: HepT-like ribonuclease domain-containing protein [Candidatus Nezhaarchaeales archaeon]
MAASINRAYVKKLASDIEEPIDAILRYTSRPYESMSEAERHAVRYNIIVIASAIAALAIHTARRLCGEEPETTLHALSILRRRGLLTELEYENLVRLIRLRNLLVHRYWTTDDERIYASVRSDFESVKNFLKRLREHVE